ASLQRESFQDNLLNPIVWMAGVMMLVADVAALAWVAMWTALTAKSPNRVTGITVVRILLAPWALYIAIMVVVMSIRSLNSLPDPKWWFNVGLWFGLGMLTDAAFGMVAWWQLRTRFRELARQPFVPISLDHEIPMFKSGLQVRAICFAVALASAGPAHAAGSSLEKGFLHPPDSARPWVFWFWLNGNINSNAITADLEAMKRAGIGGV